MGSSTSWWGSYDLPHDSYGRWRIGPTTLWAQRLEGEWRLATESTEDPDADGFELELPAQPRELLELPTVKRFGISGRGERLSLQPRLADRPIVSRPEKPFYVPAHQQVTVYLGTPLWIEIAPGQGAPPLKELPILRPSDTWFGTPRHGELCYATRTNCRLRLADVPVRPYRAITKVRVRNDAASELLLERMQLPVEYLALYVDGGGAIWTEDVELVRAEDDAPAPMRLRPGPPAAADDAERLMPARKEIQGNVLIRAFSALF